MRKFKVSTDNPVNIMQTGDVVVLDESKGITYGSGYVYMDNKGPMTYGEMIAVLDKYYKLEEITEPHIELKLVGFEEGQEFKLKFDDGSNGVYDYKIHNGIVMKFDDIDLKWIESRNSLNDFSKASIALIKEPTEREKLEQEMRDMAEAHKKQMDELADKIKGLE